MIEEVSNPHFLNNSFKMVAKNKNSPKIEKNFYQMSKFQAEKKRLKNRASFDIRHIPISLHAKLQGNRTIRQGETR